VWDDLPFHSLTCIELGMLSVYSLFMLGEKPHPAAGAGRAHRLTQPGPHIQEHQQPNLANTGTFRDRPYQTEPENEMSDCRNRL